jgi:hypothetical protein
MEHALATAQSLETQLDVLKSKANPDVNQIKAIEAQIKTQYEVAAANEKIASPIYSAAKQAAPYALPILLALGAYLLWSRK